MKKNKWANFAGDVCAVATLSVIAFSTKHVQKKYGDTNEHLFLHDVGYLGYYALDRFVLNNEKILAMLDEKLHLSEIL